MDRPAAHISPTKDLSTCEDELEKCRILSTVEMVAGFMELVSLQLAEEPFETQPRWKLIKRYVTFQNK